MKKFAFLIVFIILVFTIFTTMAVAPDANPKQWKIYNVKPDTSSYWDINKLDPFDGGAGQFTLQQFVSETSGSFAVYVLTNYNNDITGKSLSANVSWTPGSYKTRSTIHPGAFVRFEFQDTTAGQYDSNDYWWSASSLDLNSLSSGSLAVSLSDRSQWTNQSGKSANDKTEDWQQWQGDIVHMSPYDGFTKAMKNVKQVGLSFGSSGSYASGVALVGNTGTFQLINFTIN